MVYRVVLIRLFETREAEQKMGEGAEGQAENGKGAREESGTLKINLKKTFFELSFCKNWRGPVPLKLQPLHTSPWSVPQNHHRNRNHRQNFLRGERENGKLTQQPTEKLQCQRVPLVNMFQVSKVCTAHPHIKLECTVIGNYL